jgi:mannose/fructose/N-acetylgalactosamine-specific phosphotransferase system component IIC
MNKRAMNNRSMLSRVLLVAVCLTVVLATASIASACPSCRSALGGDESQGDLARGLYYSILFMMSMPFAIVGTFAALMYRAVKNEQRRKDAEAEQQESPQRSGD